MNGAIQVLVIERVFVVPKPGIWSRHLVTNEPDTIVAWIGLDRAAHRRARPSNNGRLLSHGGAHGTKTERLVDSGYAVLTVRSVVIHVALTRVTLAPGAFVRDDVFRFGKIRRPRV